MALDSQQPQEIAGKPSWYSKYTTKSTGTKLWTCRCQAEECYTISLADKNKYLTISVRPDKSKIWKQPLKYGSIH